MPGDFTEANIKIHAKKLLRLLEANTAQVAGGGDTPKHLATKAALRAKFLEWEIAGGFVEDLRTDYDALIQANELNQADKQTGVEKTETIAQILLTASQDVDDLDTVMQNKYSRQPGRSASASLHLRRCGAQASCLWGQRASRLL